MEQVDTFCTSMQPRSFSCLFQEDVGFVLLLLLFSWVFMLLMLFMVFIVHQRSDEKKRRRKENEIRKEIRSCGAHIPSCLKKERTFDHFFVSLQLFFFFFCGERPQKNESAIRFRPSK